MSGFGTESGNLIPGQWIPYNSSVPLVMVSSGLTTTAMEAFFPGWRVQGCFVHGLIATLRGSAYLLDAQFLKSTYSDEASAITSASTINEITNVFILGNGWKHF